MVSELSHSLKSEMCFACASGESVTLSNTPLWIPRLSVRQPVDTREFGYRYRGKAANVRAWSTATCPQTVHVHHTSLHARLPVR